MPVGIRLVSGNSHKALSRAISEHLEVPETSSTITRFSDGEIMLQITENVRGSDVFVIQSTCTPVNENLMELLLMLDALKRASAGRITPA